ncbi:MAG: RNA polymerase sigma-70 factor [Gemmatimonadaceae bacterium]|nr:RNA polymerase sigma-70 factor [Gemmatimonadaceae bacterium]
MDAPDLDSVLAMRVRASDGAAFEALFRAYFARLASLAFAYVKSRETAEELVQDTFLRIWETRSTWEVTGNVRSYLYAAVRHRAINHLRKARVGARVEENAAASSAHGEGWGGAFGLRVPAADAELETAELHAAIERAISELPDRCREAFALSRQHDLSHAEIAAIMGTAVKTVENQITKARTHLRRRLSPWLNG